MNRHWFPTVICVFNILESGDEQRLASCDGVSALSLAMAERRASRIPCHNHASL
jgi:hypothetical protein